MNRQLAWLWGGVAILLVAASPWADVVAKSLWGCAFKNLTGFACPSCGTVRAALALARFDVGAALTSYPLQSIGWMVLIGGGLFSLASVLAGKPLPRFPKTPSLPVRLAVVAAIVANWAYSIVTGV